MREPQSSTTCEPDHPVWRALAAYGIGPEGSALSFPQRLARENGWTLAHVERVIAEYKRFCFLAATAGFEVTPSDPVDQAWHLHLTYSRDYWDRFCPDVLGCKLHHGPTKGGGEERGRHFRQYAETLKAYERHFGPPPADIWPVANDLLSDAARARRVHPRDGMVVRRTVALGVAAALALLLLTCIVLLLRSM
ncbi:MAG: hypothetical protein AB7F98_09635 [Novosphingobium sp.]